MSGDATVDLTRSGTDRRALADHQYADETNYRARTSIYDYLDNDVPAPSFPAWALDHLDWTGSERALDAGCGPGNWLGELSRRAGSVVGVDLSFGMVAAARRAGPGAGALVARADVQALPLPSACVDVGVSAHMLYHVPDIAAALREFRRVLRPGATLLITANGADDKAELKELWEAATQEVTGRGLQTWATRFNLDVSVGVVESVFDTVEEVRSRGVFRLPTAEPVIAWMRSLRAGTEGDMSDEQWEAIVAHVERSINESIARHGVFEATKVSGLLLAR